MPGKIFDLGYKLGLQAEKDGDIDASVGYFLKAGEFADADLVSFSKLKGQKLAEAAEKVFAFDLARRLYVKFDRIYFSNESNRDEFELRARRAVSRLFERGCFSKAVEVSLVVDDSDWQAKVYDAAKKIEAYSDYSKSMFGAN